ncbi:MAG: amino acid adenylation domain-containing protein, partial [Pseudoxanthomonas sp.]
MQATQPLDARRIADFMQCALEQLDQALTSAPGTALRQLDVLPASEREQLLQTWNQTAAPYPSECGVHELFVEQAARTPDALAVIDGDQSLSYAELDSRADRLAGCLREHGVSTGDYVVTLLERSAALVIAELAILKAGAVYVPLDPRSPPMRQQWTIADCAACLVLADLTLADGADLAVPLLQINLAMIDALPAAESVPVPRRGGDLAYVMYTSGSTGTPKGVLVPHRAINRLVINNAYVTLETGDRVAFAANPAFDASTFEVWMPLLNGGTLVVIDRDTALSPAAFAQALDAYRIDRLWLTVGLFNEMAGAMTSVMPRLKTLIVGGDALDPVTIARVLTQCPPQCLLNGYGPTETTTFATTFVVTHLAEGTTRIPIGRPISNTVTYLLDAHGQPVPLGVIGELYIGGDGVALGYLNRPELTAERFLADPFSTAPHARMYRTGDLARYLPDGDLEFLGRNDHQVKIRGFRIEPGEIQARLAEHPEVRDAAVIVREDSPGNKRLVAYVVSVPGTYVDESNDSSTHGDEVNDSSGDFAARLRSHLARHLPDYMVPAAYVRLDALPLTPNGKLDREALPAPEGDAYTRRRYEAPQGAIEQTLAQLWSELLKIEQVGRHDNFFELGGHSLLAVRLLSRLPATFGVELPLATLFARPTLADFVAAIVETLAQHGSQQLIPLSRISRDQPLPLSFAQQRLWFLAQIEGVSAAYHIPLALHLRGHLDVDAWRHSLDALFARHEALRSVFVSTDGQPQVELLAADQRMPWLAHDLRHLPDAEAQLQQLTLEEAHAPFDLARGPLVRARLVQLADEDHVFLLTQHHIVSDGWSMGVLITELSALYSAFREGRANPLPPLAIQYPDYAAWQREWLSGERLQHQIEFWRGHLAEAPVCLSLPTDHPRPRQQNFAGDMVPVQIDAELARGLKQLSQRHGTTLFMTVLAAWATVLSRLSCQDDLVIGTPTANRSRQEVEPLIGFFVNTLALRVDLSGQPSGRELLQQVRQTTLAAQSHQDLPFEQVVEIINPPRHLDHTPLFQVLFAWQNNDQGHLQLPGLDVGAASVPIDVAKFDLELNLSEGADGTIAGGLSFATALFNAPTLQRHVGYLIAALRELAADDEQPVSHIPLPGDAERRLVLETWN